jgi:hypothetical protein
MSFYDRENTLCAMAFYTSKFFHRATWRINISTGTWRKNLTALIQGESFVWARQVVERRTPLQTSCQIHCIEARRFVFTKG